MRVTAGRADVNAMMVRVARQIAADRAAARQREASGDLSATEWLERDQLAVLQTELAPAAGDPLREPRVQWETLNMPFGLAAIRVHGTHSDALRNKWSLRELLTRRLHRAYRDALIAGKIMHAEQAAQRARQAQVYVAELGGINGLAGPSNE